MSQVTVEKAEGIAVVTIQREEKKNALSRALLLELENVARSFRDDCDTRAILICGSKRFFSAGVDLSEISEWNSSAMSLSERRRLSQAGPAMCQAWEEIPQITIAAVEGINIGGGVALTLACDWRVMSESTKLYMPEVKRGLPVAWRTLPRLINIVGLSRAKQLLLLDDDGVTAQQALTWGLTDFVVPDGATLNKARELAARVAALPDAVVSTIKQSANAYSNHLNHLASQMDLDQSILFGMSESATKARSEFT